MIRPYGEWPSPITERDAAAQSGSVSWPVVRGATTWWCRSDPATADVELLRRAADGTRQQVLAPGWSVRNRAIGYGGRPFAVDGDRLVLTAYHDGRIHLADAYGTASGATPLTPPSPPGTTTWYADLQLPPGSPVLWCVREVTREARGEDDSDPAPRTTRDIVTVPLSGAAADDPSAITSVARSHHFLTNVRPSPDGSQVAWIGWDHPAMPWEGTTLLVARLQDGVAGPPRALLGGPDVAVAQAEWADSGTLYAMADPDGWWNLHRVEVGGTAECVLPLPQDCAGAVWRVGATWFAVSGDSVVLARGCGEQQLSRWSPEGGLRDLAPGWTEFGADLTAADGVAVAVAGSPTHGPAVLRVPLDGAAPEVCSETATGVPAHWLSTPQRRTATDAAGQVVHYVFHPPANPLCSGPDDTRPPLLIHVHGGPTSHTGATPDVEFSLFTSRGFAVASVDYGGSTGYGREYRERLRHNWGVVDVADSVTVAEALAAAGEVDPDRIAIRGGSAGGWTTLACLSSTTVFCAGAVYYPISDPLRWSGGNTHDFESRYLQSLIGRLPEDRDRYERVSPLRHVDAITVPLVMLQGADDQICPPVHARAVIDAVRERGLWHRLEIFPGEGHGFRRAESVATSLAAELELYDHAMALNGDTARGER